MLASRETSIFQDRQLVQALHQAYADKTESFYLGLGSAPGDPCKVQLKSFGSTRTSIAVGHDWTNRATLVGDEDDTRLDEIAAHFAEHGQRCHIEWNPGNCYAPGSWKDELGQRLIDRGFRPGGFRCVWAMRPQEPVTDPATSIEVRRFGADQIDEYLDVLAIIEGQTVEKRAEGRLMIKHGQGDGRWTQYVGYVDGIPCSNATLFRKGTIACLDWGQTLKEHRGRGCHNALIRQRLSDAHAAGCDVAFAVSDIGIPSARNLQRHGFELAYNYVMLRRDP